MWSCQKTQKRIATSRGFHFKWRTLDGSKALRDELKVKKSEKFVMACQFLFEKKNTIWIASPIYLNPVGDMDFKGLSANTIFQRFRKPV
jgi:hypothetical protein